MTGAFSFEDVSDEIAAVGRVLDEVEEAVARLELGAYGLCARCGEAIDGKDLDADPLLRHCTRHRRAVQP
jgi:RNA polymerase-binding transcription factor DksA